MVRWTVPDGRYPWQVAGDTPYAELDRDLRVIQFGSRPLAIATSWYDGDWFYARDLGRVSFLRLAIPEKPPQEVQGTVEIIPDASGRSDAELLALATGEPVSVEVASGASLQFVRARPTASASSAVPQREPASRRRPTGPGASTTTKGTCSPKASSGSTSRPGPNGRASCCAGVEGARGSYFLAGELTWPGGRRLVRTTLGVLAQRKPELRPDSPFGIAGIICNPETYPDQPELDAVLGLCARIGVHWVRGLGFPIRAGRASRRGDEGPEPGWSCCAATESCPTSSADKAFPLTRTLRGPSRGLSSDRSRLLPSSLRMWK